jgi:hypothetical protein
MSRVRITVLAVLVAASVLVQGGALGATPKTTTGTIHILASLNLLSSSPNIPVIVTGVIGDYGTATTIDANGKLDQNGNYEKVVLKKGTFEINSTAINKVTNSEEPTFNKVNCSGWQQLSGPPAITLFDGTGAYAGIKGSLIQSQTFALVGPTLKDGKCNPSQNAAPLAAYGIITATGTVTF